ncbi:Asp-tRNA(Asn)/Glu-tRNA(Gln) amidotransferase subunit GatA [Roseimaritima sediminicola]|uniref:Asp-tRNA(Asn)/Glu-tRNA(Gln) amidotransferase subunit GatA n=1 Tax=Roseimaritima sediminicola TaxID=2662066 RepID=UPI0012983364|nr:Asp-tRNA(Asn)/Glu-tRNA(Gln) amidotransferase subunit GatA [Roseimaritima sediminicola]
MTIPLDSAVTLQSLLASGELSAVDVARSVLERAAATESTVAAFTYRPDERLLEQAEAIDRRRREGQPLGPLAGIPVAVKDVLCTTDMPTTCSSRMLENFRSPYDATVVAQLRAADALLVGKTNMDEFAMGASTENSAFGLTRNPWASTCTPGGSSGGAAAAVAASVVPLSVGSDTGGSIRQPAAFCGVTGLKPTYGRVSRYGLVAFASSLDQVGPLAWDVADNALLLSHLAGFDPRDSTSLDAPVEDYLAAVSPAATADLKGLRIGLIREHVDHQRLAAPARQAVLDAVGVLTAAGAEVVDVHFDQTKYWVPTYYIIAPCEASSNLSRYDGAHYGFRAQPAAEAAQQHGPLTATYCQSRDQGFGAEVKRRIMLGTYSLSEGYADRYYAKALQVRRLIRDDYDAAFGKVDLLLGPVTPGPAFPLGEKVDDPLEMYLCDQFTVGANLAGIPAISLPAGHDENNLPLGVQLQAPPLGEAALLRAGTVFQNATDHHRRRPQL